MEEYVIKLPFGYLTSFEISSVWGMDVGDTDGTADEAIVFSSLEFAEAVSAMLTIALKEGEAVVEEHTDK